MSFSIVIADPDFQWGGSLKNFLIEKKFQVELAENGKAAQAILYKKKCDFVIMDLGLQDYSSFEVLRYIKLNSPEVRVIITMSSKDVLKRLDITESTLQRFGASLILFKPMKEEAIFKIIEKEYKIDSWKDVRNYQGTGESEPVTAPDEEFTRIKFENFLSGSTTIFDHYIRLGKDNYVKILHQGESFDQSRLKKYESANLDFLYFKTSDRTMYIAYTTELLKKLTGKSAATVEKKVSLNHSVVEKYLEQIYSVGLRPGLVEEGKEICENMFNLIDREPDLASVFKSYTDYDPPIYAHLFLTSFFSVLICKHLEWAGPRTIQVVALGALLHDIGKVKLPHSLREKDESLMTPAELELYQTHPRLGADLLSKFSSIPEPVKQVVFQHHEYVDGSGYPIKLMGSKIYPMAKIVSLCDAFSTLLIKKQLAPLPGLREFVGDRANIMLFDPTMVKALIQGFCREKA